MHQLTKVVPATMVALTFHCSPFCLPLRHCGRLHCHRRLLPFSSGHPVTNTVVMKCKKVAPCNRLPPKRQTLRGCDIGDAGSIDFTMTCDGHIIVWLGRRLYLKTPHTFKHARTSRPAPSQLCLAPGTQTEQVGQIFEPRGQQISHSVRMLMGSGAND